ncbi:hypothetical protein RN001_003125 [Aquatica leii]|uniref:TLC domain-containing protein n=1 Tax=Aquatica leii TaxID=1421715 RepID=A0AAN7PHW0_9COLE|nr:hypothetical protein RN001_003125 [Aquatica leii]
MRSRVQVKEPPFSSWSTVGVSVIFWSALYLTTQSIFRDKSPEFCSRVVTLLHGSAATVFGAGQCFSEVSPWDIPDEPTTFSQGFFLAMSLGYFLMDLLWCLYFQTESALMIGHHIYSCIALMRMLFRGTYGHQATCALGVLEATNPLLQARWFIRAYGMQHTPLFICVELIFIALFILIRIILGSVGVFYIITGPYISLEFKILAVVIYVVSWLFMINICRYFAYKYMEHSVEVELNNNINSSYIRCVVVSLIV